MRQVGQRGVLECSLEIVELWKYYKRWKEVMHGDRQGRHAGEIFEGPKKCVIKRCIIIR